MSLYTILIDRLCHGRATLMQTNAKKAYRFDSRGVYLLDISHPLQYVFNVGEDYICLCDNDTKGDFSQPNDLLLDSVYALIQASSYQPKRWSNWWKRGKEKQQMVICPDPAGFIFDELA